MEGGISNNRDKEDPSAIQSREGDGGGDEQSQTNQSVPKVGEASVVYPVSNPSSRAPSTLIAGSRILQDLRNHERNTMKRAIAIGQGPAARERMVPWHLWNECLGSRKMIRQRDPCGVRPQAKVWYRSRR